ncbi:hypothetical protein ABVK25_011971 [Lepraria finkii]|uniref:Uncharacterized protein n=1 Tax=Lepraria finkii TaxID=1340010 RepID=A0ABR4AJB2_9LECA
MHLEYSPERLVQHAQALRSPRRNIPSRGIGGGQISLFTPLDPTSDFQPRDPLKQSIVPIPAEGRFRAPPSATTPRQPAWMSLLPSNVNKQVRPDSHSAMQRRLTFPYSRPARLSTPNSTTPGHPPASPGYASALSTAGQGIEEERRRVSASAAYLPTRSISTPKSWAAGATRHGRRLRLDHETTLQDFQNFSTSLHEAHHSSVMPTQQQDQEVAPQRRSSISSLKIPKRRQSTKNPSPTTHDHSCTEASHTPLPDQNHHHPPNHLSSGNSHLSSELV